MKGAKSVLVSGMLVVKPLTSRQGCDPAEAKFGLSVLFLSFWEGLWLSPMGASVQAEEHRVALGRGTVRAGADLGMTDGRTAVQSR